MTRRERARQLVRQIAQRRTELARLELELESLVPDDELPGGAVIGEASLPPLPAANVVDGMFPPPPPLPPMATTNPNLFLDSLLSPAPSSYPNIYDLGARDPNWFLRIPSVYIPSPPSLSEKILGLLETQPREWEANEVRNALAHDNVDTIRSTLARLHAHGRINRASYGRYTSLNAAPKVELGGLTTK